MSRMGSLVVFHFCVLFVFGTSPVHKRVRGTGLRLNMGSSSASSASSLEGAGQSTGMVHTAGGENMFPCTQDDNYPSEIWFEWMQTCRNTSPSPKSIATSLSSESLDAIRSHHHGGESLRKPPQRDWTDRLSLPASIAPRFAPFIKRQVEADLENIHLWRSGSQGSTAHHPDWLSGSEITPWGEVIIDDSVSIAQTKTATVYKVRMISSKLPPGITYPEKHLDPVSGHVRSGRLVIKYQADPATHTLPLHSLMVDGWMLKHLEADGVTPKLYFLSPQFPTPRERPLASAKLNFINSSSQKIWDDRFFRGKRFEHHRSQQISPPYSNAAAVVSPEEQQQQVSSMDEIRQSGGSPPSSMWGATLLKSIRSSPVDRPFFSSVRFAVMEQVGWSIHRLVHTASNGRHPLSHALALGANMIESLKTIHNRGVVHGDIHSGNICLEYVDKLTLNVKMFFIDFGRAFFDSNLKHTRIREAYSINDPLYSHWDLEGWMPGKRDDLFKVFLVISVMLNGNSIYSFLKSLEVEQAWHWKARDNMFITPSYNVFNPQSPEFQQVAPPNDGVAAAAFVHQVRERMEYMLLQLRSIETIHVPINYDAFIGEMRSISRAILKKTPLPPLDPNLVFFGGGHHHISP